MLVYGILIILWRTSLILCERIFFSYRINVVNSDNFYLIGTFSSVDVNWCIQMCKSTDACTFINYLRLAHVCGIIGQLVQTNPTNFVINSLFSVKHQGFIYGDKSKWTNDQWNSNRKAGCGPPPGVSMTTVRGNMYTPESVTQYICTNNAMRTARTMCQPSGSWSPVTILCIPAECYTSPHTGVGFYKSSCYKHISTKQPWSSAKVNCENLGGYLVDITDRYEMGAVVRYIETIPNYNVDDDSRRVYIGLTDLDKEGTYKWLDGNVTTYYNWAIGEPRGSNTENYVMFGTWDCFWHDCNCFTLYGSLCEFLLR